MGGDVLAAHLHQRVAIGQVALVAHHRAHVALRMVILGLREPIVDEKGRAACQFVTQGAHK